jgi:hypothetical protein
MIRRIGYLDTVHLDMPGGCFGNTGHTFQKRRLPATARTNDADELATANVEIDLPDSGDRTAFWQRVDLVNASAGNVRVASQAIVRLRFGHIQVGTNLFV